MFLAILPEIGLLVLAIVVLALDAFLRKSNRSYLGWVTAGGLVLVGVLAAIFSRPGAEPQLIWGGMLRLDAVAFAFRLIFLSGAALTALFAADSPTLGKRGEFYALLLLSTLGMSLMSAAYDLMMIYLAIETTSIPLYVLAGFLREDQKSPEAGIKYLLFGAMTSAVMLFGFSLLYGFTGETRLDLLVSAAKSGTSVVLGDLPTLVYLLPVMLILVGLSFKISAVPFHFWAPDVYEGAPTPVAGFLSTASKAAGFAVLLRMLVVVFPDWTILIAILSAASMTVGNLLALAQKNIKRLLAYSSIAQAGYMLVGLAAGNELGASAVVYYLAAYLVTNLAAFGIVTLVGKTTGSDEISSYAGLSRRSPGLALALLAALLSLGGVPPFAGFFGKLLVFGSAIKAGMLWLAILGVLNSVLGLYYYLMVLKAVYLGRSEEDSKPLKVSPAWTTALVIAVVGVIVLGFVFSPWYGLAESAARTLWIY
jgi:NADH-quinone oxidoreductase subunit N